MAMESSGDGGCGERRRLWTAPVAVSTGGVATAATMEVWGSFVDGDETS